MPDSVVPDSVVLGSVVVARVTPRKAVMMRRSALLSLFLTILGFNLLALAAAHETRVVGPAGGDQYKVIVGQLNEPVFTDLRSGLDLIVRHAADDTPVEGLENSLTATITAPDGEVRQLTIQPQYGKPGSYKDDYILTVPGTYTIEVSGYIGSLQVDEAYQVEAGDVTSIRFP